MRPKIVFVQNVKYIYPNCKIYLSKLPQEATPASKPSDLIWVVRVLFSKLQHIFVEIANSICQKCKIYLSQLLPQEAIPACKPSVLIWVVSVLLSSSISPLAFQHLEHLVSPLILK